MVHRYKAGDREKQQDMSQRKEPPREGAQKPQPSPLTGRAGSHFHGITSFLGLCNVAKTEEIGEQTADFRINNTIIQENIQKIKR